MTFLFKSIFQNLKPQSCIFIASLGLIYFAGFQSFKSWYIQAKNHLKDSNFSSKNSFKILYLLVRIYNLHQDWSSEFPAHKKEHCSNFPGSLRSGSCLKITSKTEQKDITRNSITLNPNPGKIIHYF